MNLNKYKLEPWHSDSDTYWYGKIVDKIRKLNHCYLFKRQQDRTREPILHGYHSCELWVIYCFEIINTKSVL